MLFVPFAGHWRIDLQCRPDDDAEAFGGERVKDWLPLVIDAKYAERVTWVSTYVFMQVLAREFVDPTRRVLLVGEAAHLFAPFGARGLNSGIPDAIVAARAIRAALDASTAVRRAPRSTTSPSPAAQPPNGTGRPRTRRSPTSPRRTTALEKRRAAAAAAPATRRRAGGSTPRPTARGSGRRTRTGCSTEPRS